MQNLLTPSNISSGLCQKVYIALYEFFIDGGIKSVDPNSIEINTSHQFKSGNFGFIECDLMPQKNKFNAKQIGDLAGNTFEFELEIFIQGGYLENHSQQKKLLNKPLIVLFKDEKITYQIGTNNKPAYLMHQFTTGTDKDGVKGYLIKIQTIGCYVQIYNGLIKPYEGTYPNNGMPIFYNLTKLQTNSLQQMIDAYSYAFSYSISQILSILQTRSSNYAIQLQYRDDNNVFIDILPATIDTSSILNFINSLTTILNATNNGNFTFQLFGSKLLVINDSVLTGEQYLGLALVQLGILAEDGEYLITEDEQFIIPE